jgi:putative acyl-CoA dehydrogenase
MIGSDRMPDQDLFNQPPPFEDVNLFISDAALRDAVRREGGGWAEPSLERFGATAGSRHMLDQARLANEYPPRLKLFDARGCRLDQVEYHPAYHALMAASTAEGLHASVWSHLADSSEPLPGRSVARAGAFYMAAQMEAGHCCPITMTSAAVPVVRQAPGIAEAWLARILARDYDPSFRPHLEKRGLTIGMAMTEKQGGSDVRANLTTAVPAGASAGAGAEYLVSGHKWFMSAPMSDAFLVLAQAPGGLSCFFMPRFLPDGTRNAILLQRLKDKCGNRSNASSEVEFHRAHAWLVGEEGRGVATIMEMVTLTRLDCAISSAGLMRWGLANALHHCCHRTAFQKKLIDQPLMRSVLADLALDHEAAVALVFRLARAFERSGEDEVEAAFSRILTPAIKYWVCKVLPGFAYEAMECLGGNGYVEESTMARLYRESPLNAIWEGSGNIMCLDVLRAVNKSPEALAGLLESLQGAAHAEPRLAAAVVRLRDRLAAPSGVETDLRDVVENLVQVVAAALLTASAPAAVADAFIASRLDGGFRRTYGLARGADVDAILARALPGTKE